MDTQKVNQREQQQRQQQTKKHSNAYTHYDIHPNTTNCYQSGRALKFFASSGHR